MKEIKYLLNVLHWSTYTSLWWLMAKLDWLLTGPNKIPLGLFIIGIWTFILIVFAWFYIYENWNKK